MANTATAQNEKNIEQIPTLSLRNRFGYGVGDLGLNVFWNMTNLFVLFYYTDVLGLSNSVAGAIVMGAMVWDGVTDPIVGLLASRTRTKWGRYRPYLFVFAVPLAAAFVLMFTNPGVTGTALILYVVATHVLFRTFYTLVAIPYGAMSARITQDSNLRGTLAVWRMVAAAIGATFVAGLTVEGARYLGDGELSDGFAKVAMIFAIFAACSLFLSFFNTDEDFKTDTSVQQETLTDILRMLRENSAFWVVFFAVLVGMVASTITGKTALYYIKYNLGAEDYIGIMSASIALTIVIFVPFWGIVSKRVGKKLVWQIGMSISGVAGVLLYLNPIETPNVVISIMFFGSIGAAASYFSFWAVLPDTVEFGEWKTGIRAESVLFGAATFAQKVALGVSVGFLGLILDLIGYSANEVQTPETIGGLKLLVSLVPAAIIFLNVLLVARYPLTQEKHAQIVKEINARN